MTRILCTQIAQYVHSDCYNFDLSVSSVIFLSRCFAVNLQVSGTLLVYLNSIVGFCISTRSFCLVNYAIGVCILSSLGSLGLIVGSSLAQNTPPYFLYQDFFEVQHLHSALGGWLHSVTHNIFYLNMHWFDLM